MNATKDPIVKTEVPTPEPLFSKRDGSFYQWHGDRGPVIALVHGLGLNHHMWQWQIPALSRRHRVLSYDLYGHGLSPCAATRHSLEVFAQQLAGLLDECGVNHCAVVGFSLGGMIARRFAMDYPQRVSAVAVLNSPHARSTDQQRAILSRVTQARSQGPSATVDAAIKRWFTEDYKRKNPKVIDLVRQWVLANDPRVYPENYRVLAEGVAELVRPEPPIECPALIIAAEDDPGQTPQMAKAMASEIPHSQTHVLPNLRHMAPVEAPEQYNRLILSFIENISASQP